LTHCREVLFGRSYAKRRVTYYANQERPVMIRLTPRNEPSEPSLRRWSSADGAAGDWPPVVPSGDVWDRDLKRLLTAVEHPAFSASHLVPDAGELAVRRAVHGFGGEALAVLHAIENGWRDFSVQPTFSLPLELREDGP
jgi:hypothetical protein